MKLYFMKFVPADWLKDTRILTLPERGAWADILCLLWESKTRGEKTMPLADWAQFLGLDEGQAAHILAELKRKEIADVIICNSVVTVKNRRMLRDEKERFETRKRVEKHRRNMSNAESNEPVTDIVRVRSKRLEVRSKNIDARIKNLNPPTPLSGGIEIPENLKMNEPEILDWLAYKREKGQHYKPRGLHALWKRLEAIPQGERKQAIEFSMASNYAGIFPAKGGNDGKNKSSPTGAVAAEPGKYDNAYFKPTGNKPG